jgi:streptogramin lyase
MSERHDLDAIEQPSVPHDVRRLLAIILLLVTTPCIAEVRRRAAQPPGFSVFQTPDASAVLVAAPDGSIWFAGADVGTIAVDGRLKLVAGGVNCSVGPVVRSDDALVCLSRSATEDVLRVVRPSGQIDTVSLGAFVGAGSLVAAPDGTIMFIERNTRRIGRLTLDGVVNRIELPRAIVPEILAVASDGTVWFIAGPTLVRMIADGTYDVFRDDALFERRHPGAGFSGLVAGSDGTLWLSIPTESRTSGYHRTGAIVAFTPDGSFHEELVINSPTLMATAPDASVWFIQDVAPGFEPTYIPELVHFVRQSEPRTFYVPYAFWPVHVFSLAVDSQNRPWLALTDSIAGPRIAVLR